MRFVFAIAALLLMPVITFAADPAPATSTPAAAAPAKAFTFDDAFVRETPIQVSAGYILITNTTGQDDTLVGVSADWAGKIQIHNVKIDNDGVLNMIPIEALSIKNGETAKFTPSGRHLMIFGVKDKLVVGQTRNITLTFDKAGKVVVPFIVQPVTYRGKDAAKKAGAAPAAASDKKAADSMADMPGMTH